MLDLSYEIHLVVLKPPHIHTVDLVAIIIKHNNNNNNNMEFI